MADGTSAAQGERLRSRLEQALLAGCAPVGHGVRAWTVDTPTALEVRGLVVEPEHRGGWAFLRWLRSLPDDRKVVVVHVTDERLAHVFERAGFSLAHRYDPERDEWVRIHVRRPTGAARHVTR